MFNSNSVDVITYFIKFGCTVHVFIRFHLLRQIEGYIFVHTAGGLTCGTRLLVSKIRRQLSVQPIHSMLDYKSSCWSINKVLLMEKRNFDLDGSSQLDKTEFLCGGVLGISSAIRTEDGFWGTDCRTLGLWLALTTYAFRIYMGLEKIQ